MSDKDIEKGSRGLGEVAKALDAIKVAIICVTPDNLNAPWLLYEAGALSKTIDDETRLCTLLLGGLQIQDVKPPLGMFQATKAIEKDDFRRLIHTINRAVSEDPLLDQDLDSVFDAMWPQLEQTLTALPPPTKMVSRSQQEVLEELVSLVRSQSNIAYDNPILVALRDTRSMLSAVLVKLGAESSNRMAPFRHNRARYSEEIRLPDVPRAHVESIAAIREKAGNLVEHFQRDDVFDTAVSLLLAEKRVDAINLVGTSTTNTPEEAHELIARLVAVIKQMNEGAANPA
jgi:hypothetical protein